MTQLSPPPLPEEQGPDAQQKQSEQADAFHPQASLPSHDARDEFQAYRPPSRLAFSIFLLILVVSGLLLSVWGITPGVNFLPR